MTIQPLLTILLWVYKREILMKLSGKKACNYIAFKRVRMTPKKQVFNKTTHSALMNTNKKIISIKATWNRIHKHLQKMERHRAIRIRKESLTSSLQRIITNRVLPSWFQKKSVTLTITGNRCTTTRFNLTRKSPEALSRNLLYLMRYSL